MQMRSAEEAQSFTMEQNAQPSMSRDAETPTPQNDESSASQTDAGAAADQETANISAPDDPIVSSDVTIQPNRAQGPVARRQAAQVPEYVPLPAPRQAAIDPDATTTLTFTPNTAAGISYLLLWISGVLIFFNERRNRYVRFHALQSILFGALATVAGVFASVITALLVDLSHATHWQVFGVIGWGVAVLTAFTVVVLWSSLAVAAWTGGGFALPILGRYAKQYAAPEDQLLPTPHA